jgi:hypothetical protein
MAITDAAVISRLTMKIFMLSRSESASAVVGEGIDSRRWVPSSYLCRQANVARSAPTKTPGIRIQLHMTVLSSVMIIAISSCFRKSISMIVMSQHSLKSEKVAYKLYRTRAKQYGDSLAIAHEAWQGQEATNQA